MRQLLLSGSTWLLLALCGCGNGEDFQKPDQEKAPAGGSFEVVPFPGIVQGTQDRYDLKASKVIDLVDGTWDPEKETGKAAERKRFRFGKKGAVTEIYWVRTGASSKGDIYQFTMRQIMEGRPDQEQTKEITYAGQAMDLFVYGSHRFALEPVANAPFEVPDFPVDGEGNPSEEK